MTFFAFTTVKSTPDKINSLNFVQIISLYTLYWWTFLLVGALNMLTASPTKAWDSTKIDTKLHLMVKLQFWRFWVYGVTSSLPLLPGLLWLGVPVRWLILIAWHLPIVLFPEVRKSCSLNIHICIFYVVVSVENFLHTILSNTNNFYTDLFNL